MRSVQTYLGYCQTVARWWRSNTGAGKLQRRDGVSQWMVFGFPGSPDIHGFMRDGRALFIEVKRPSGAVRPEQERFISDARAAGCVAFIARSVNDAVRELGAA